MNFILFPHQLFELTYIPQEYHSANFFLVEHEKFYGKTNNMNFNKKKILLHKASSLAYVDTLKKKINIEYTDTYPTIKNSKVIFFDTVDHFLNDEIKEKYHKSNDLIMLENPNFMTSKTDLENYFQKHKKKNFIHSSFYTFQLNLHDIPYISKSYDTENRNAIPKNIQPPQFPKENKNKFIKTAAQFVETKFKNNYGDTDNFYLPITHQEAKKFFDLFLENKAEFFAEYQDAIIPQEPFLFHSVISSSMNIGLINPDYVIAKTIEAYENKKISLKDYEAFIRQVIGWREYQRFIYLFLAKEIVSKNHFNNTGRLTSAWYTGDLGIPPVDDAIKIAFKHGYLHHIIRLMVMCNFMNLCGINPHEVYVWMMEFSTDSYEWVMIGNVYSMGMWSDGGMTMRKPYISSANYVQKMSGNRYKKGEWQDFWHALYYNFLIKNRAQLKKTIYIRNLSHLEKMSQQQIANIKNLSESFIKKYTA
jgi:deoxyribodipyrimidine photolyase-related protein